LAERSLDVKIVRLLTKNEFLVTWMLFGFFLAYACALRLRLAPPFRRLFAQTCFYVPANEVPVTLAVFLIGFVSATACLALSCRRSPALRRLLFGITVASISFAAGVFLTCGRQ
jgi:hypothetical protein